MKTKLFAFGLLMMSGVCAMAATRYVVPPGGSGTPGGGYTSWDTAATNLQDAAAATAAGDTVLVTNGTYYLSGQITVTNFTIRSFNNGDVDRDGTIINANYPNVSSRCFTLSHSNALVEGFTITNGYLAVGSGGGVSMSAGRLLGCLVTGNKTTNSTGYGGGVYAAGATCVISNCDIIANTVLLGNGGGAYVTTSAQLWNSRIKFNLCPAGYGVGVNLASGGIMCNCEIISNITSAAAAGGGVCISSGNTIRNCLIVGNRNNYGGGVGCSGSGGTLENCTIVGNTSGSTGPGIGSTWQQQTITIRNTICRDTVAGYSTLKTFNIYNSCLASTIPAGSDTFNVTNTITTPPSFVNAAGGNYRLQPWSAGVDAGTNQGWMGTATELDGQSRISANNLVDMGAYETTAASTAIQYVAHGGQTPVSPYTNDWASAASNLSDAVDAGLDGTIVLVSNGVYALTNQIVVGNRTIKSDNNGALDIANTIIDGNNFIGKPVTNRCFVMSSDLASVEGLTITNGYVNGNGGGVYISAGTLKNCLVTGNAQTNGSGGGVYATGTSSLITNCDLIANRTYLSGAGACLVTSAQMRGSRVRWNRGLTAATIGAGVYLASGGFLYNSEISSNFTPNATGNIGGGVGIANGCTVRNCLIIGNVGNYGGGVGCAGAGGTIENCTILNNTAGSTGPGIGTGVGAQIVQIRNTISRDVVASYSDAATFFITNSCLVSTNWTTKVSGSGNITTAPAFIAPALGDYRQAPSSRAVDVGLLQAWMTNATDLAGNPRVSVNNLPDMGAYETMGGAPGTYYVAQNGQTPVSPYTNSWAEAASNIQDAISVMFEGSTVLVSNGVYTLTGQINMGSGAMRSYNNGVVDRDGTIVNGNWPNTTNRCLMMNHVDALVEGFTFTNGYVNGDGGGVYITNGILRNCLVVGNTSSNGGGGGVFATEVNTLITNCTVAGNVAYGSGGGVYLDRSARLVGSRIDNNRVTKPSSFGAGVCMGNAVVVQYCQITSNQQVTADPTTQSGGGVWMSYNNATLRNCLIARNASRLGGGIGMASAGQGGTVESCTIVSNSASIGAGIGLGGLGGVSAVQIRNTICWDGAGIWYGAPTYPGVAFTLVNSCLPTTNIVGATNSVSINVTTNNPQFVDAARGNFRVKGPSPCVDTGTNAAWMIGAVDLDGNPRISPLIDGTVDMGAYEFPVQQGSIFTVR